MTNVLVDTNILIYALDTSSSFYSKCVKILQNEEYNLITTTKNISELFAVCSKMNVDFNITMGYYSDIKKNFTILKPSDQSLILFEELIRKYKPRGNRVYDIEIVSMMMASDIRKIATINLSDFNTLTEVELVEFH